MAERTGTIEVIPGIGTMVDFQEPDVALWTFIPGISDWSHDDGSRSTSTVNVFEGNAGLVGDKDIAPVSFTIGAFLPYMPWYQTLKSLDREQATISWRVRKPGRQKLAEATASRLVAVEAGTGDFAKYGGLTFSGTEIKDVDNFLATQGITRGSVLTSGSVEYVVVSVDETSAGALTAFAPATGAGGIRVRRSDGADVVTAAAAVFTLSAPGIAYAFPARIQQLGGLTAGSDAGNVYSGTFSVMPTVEVPDPVLFLG